MTLKEELAKIDGLEMTTIQWEEPDIPSHIVFRDVISIFGGEKIMQTLQGGWLNLNQDFGLPYVNYVVGLRTKAGRELLDLLRSIGENPSPARVGGLLEEIVIKHRHWQFGSGKAMSVCGFMSKAPGLTLMIQVVSPGLPKVPCYEFAPEVWLEPCRICRKDVPFDNHRCFVFREEVGEIMVCSKECEHVAMSAQFVERKSVDWQEKGIAVLKHGKVVGAVVPHEVMDPKFNIENLPLPIVTKGFAVELPPVKPLFTEKSVSPFDPAAKKTKREDMP
jgi:hypothetical protein